MKRPKFPSFLYLVGRREDNSPASAWPPSLQQQRAGAVPAAGVCQHPQHQPHLYPLPTTSRHLSGHTPQKSKHQSEVPQDLSTSYMASLHWRPNHQTLRVREQPMAPPLSPRLWQYHQFSLAPLFSRIVASSKSP